MNKKEENIVIDLIFYWKSIQSSKNIENILADFVKINHIHKKES